MAMMNLKRRPMEHVDNYDANGDDDSKESLADECERVNWRFMMIKLSEEL